jgi:DNA-binding transcriptional ArsR family regulator
MNTQLQLDLVFAALADPTRRALLARLAQGEATVNELAEPFGLRQPTISKHLRVLEDAGLIQQTRDAQRRPRRLVVGGPLQDVDTWLRPFREQWERRFNSLDSYLQKLNQK